MAARKQKFTDPPPLAPSREVPAMLLDFDPVKLQADQITITAEAAEIVQDPTVVKTPQELAVVVDFLREKLNEKASIIEQRRKATGPLYAVIKTVEAWFRPWLEPYERIEPVLRKSIGDYEIAQVRARTQAMAEATRLVASPTPPTGSDFTAALVAANAAPVRVAGASAQVYWVAEVIAPDLLQREFLCPDLAKIQAHADRFDSHQTPSAIPGVRFNLGASTRVRK